MGTESQMDDHPAGSGDFYEEIDENENEYLGDGKYYVEGEEMDNEEYDDADASSSHPTLGDSHDSLLSRHDKTPGVYTPGGINKEGKKNGISEVDDVEMEDAVQPSNEPVVVVERLRNEIRPGCVVDHSSAHSNPYANASYEVVKAPNDDYLSYFRALYGRQFKDMDRSKPAVDMDHHLDICTYQGMPDDDEDEKGHVIFQVLTIEQYTRRATSRDILPGISSPEDSRCDVMMLRMYGVTRDQKSVTCHVRNFCPYFYADLPFEGFSEAHIPLFIKSINDYIAHLKRQNNHNQRFFTTKRRDELRSRIIHMEIVNRKKCMYFNDNKEEPVLKIVFNTTDSVRSVREALEKGEVPFLNGTSLQLYEIILFQLRYMIDKDVSSMKWVKMPLESVCGYGHGNLDQRTSHTTYEFEISEADIISLDFEQKSGKYSSIAPYRVLTYDMECAAQKGFPSPSKDPIVAIAGHVSVIGCKPQDITYESVKFNPLTQEEEHKPLKNSTHTALEVQFVLGTCAPIEGKIVHTFETEQAMSMAWRCFVVAVDPDVYQHYNGSFFDNGYMRYRWDAIEVPMLPQFGRIVNKNARITVQTFNSKARGKTEKKNTLFEGRVDFDLMTSIRIDYKHSSYSLDNMAAFYLGDRKADMDHKQMYSMAFGTDQTRRIVAIYNSKDTLLTQRIADVLMVFTRYSELARVCGIQFSWLCDKGQQIRIQSRFIREAKRRGFILYSKKAHIEYKEKFTGAYVIEPKSNFYENPVATLDFASLYPSIMISKNLCYSTWVPPHMVKKVTKGREDMFYRSPPSRDAPDGDVFAKVELHKGIMTDMLEGILKARKQAQTEMKNETDPMKKMILDGRQLALKMVANSGYGYTGANYNPCYPIPRTVTSEGREGLNKTKNEVEARWGHEVIYGDTDSVMVLLKGMTVAQAIEWGKEAAAHVTKLFTAPMKLEFEKVYYPYLLISKKRYGALYWTKPDKYDKLDMKGIEAVRRDNCQLVRSTQWKLLRHLLIDRSKEACIKLVKETVANLVQGKANFSDLIISKSLSRAPEEYAVPAPHTELAIRVAKRDPAGAYAIGDRVPYVIVEGLKNDKMSERAEDPLYVIENNIRVDWRYYLNNQLENPVMAVCGVVCGNEIKRIFSGAHVLPRAIENRYGNHGMLKFTKKQQQCQRCGVLFSSMTNTKKNIDDNKPKGTESRMTDRKVDHEENPLRRVVVMDTPTSKKNLVIHVHSSIRKNKDGVVEVAYNPRTLCLKCKPHAAEFYNALVNARNEAANKIASMRNRCKSCLGENFGKTKCVTRSCPIFYTRFQKRNELERYEQKLIEW